ncbi:hypothetical protein [Acetobacter lovaniensis]|uniref:Uncharacterized protein n=1 Tax=Acetobacter lovaniensis TaxID=104100 RepID=A0A841QDP9_9PROT|nr:hypothetical protein [Acetobacter lovaniensis]MBB6457009.1 hypothetical protein [Acetobacter lovaniensis]NHN81010.1 hypothetical protein [Acetobacter lovaniensis]GBQ69513.1 hypothetical protein AA0474_1944 [Acetobacter lovaniensis NRIC 0474]
MDGDINSEYPKEKYACQKEGMGVSAKFIAQIISLVSLVAVYIYFFVEYGGR